MLSSITAVDRVLNPECNQCVSFLAVELVYFFGSSERSGVGQLTATTPLSEQAIRDALPGNYRLRRGMKSVNGNIEPYYEALKEGQVMMTIEGHSGTITRITTTDSAVKTAGGVRIGTPFSTLYRRAFGHCRKENHSTTMAIVCQAEGSQHISYVFSGEWHYHKDCYRRMIACKTGRSAKSSGSASGGWKLGFARYQ